MGFLAPDPPTPAAPPPPPPLPPAAHPATFASGLVQAASARAKQIAGQIEGKAGGTDKTGASAFGPAAGAAAATTGKAKLLGDTED